MHEIRASRNDAGSIFAVMRVLPGTYAVHGDPDLFLTFHSQWADAKAAFVAAVGKNKRPAAKNEKWLQNAAVLSATVAENALRNWGRADENSHLVHTYVDNYAMGFVGLTYANGIVFQFGTKFYFFEGEDEIPNLLDEFEAFRYPAKLIKKPDQGTGRMTMAELDALMQVYGLETAPVAKTDENSPL